MRLAEADPGFFEGGDLGAAEAHLRAPFMRAAHKGCEYVKADYQKMRQKLDINW